MTEVAVRTGFLSPMALAVGALWHREVIRFFRQRSRILGALGTPLIFWLVIGSGLGRSFQAAGSARTTHYLEYVFPGTVIMIALFTSIFSMISIIEDRKTGFLQGVLAAPIPRRVIVFGKVAGAATLAVLQSLVFLMLAPLVGVSLTLGAVLFALAALIIISIGLGGLGFLIAWPMDSTQGFHAVMNLFLVPMWLLSGALFPAGGASSWLAWLMSVNPLTYAVALMRHALYNDAGSVDPNIPSLWMSVGITMLFSVLTLGLSAGIVSREGRGWSMQQSGVASRGLQSART